LTALFVFLDTRQEEKGHEPYPLGKADLMKYYAYGNIYPDDYQSTEIDIKSLIWLSRIKSQGILK